MFNIKPLVSPPSTNPNNVQLILLSIFILNILTVKDLGWDKGKDLRWDEDFNACIGGFTIPSPLVKGGTENIAIFDLRVVGDGFIIFARCNEDWSKYLTHYQYDIATKTWIPLSTEYSASNADFKYLNKLSRLHVN